MPTTRSLILDIEERRQGNALAAAGKDMRQLANETERTEDRFELFQRDMRKVQGEIGKSTAKVRELRTEIARTGDESLFGDLRKEEARLRNLRSLMQNLSNDFKTIENGVDTIPSAGGSLFSFRSPAIIAGLASLVAVAAAPLGAIIAGAVVGTVGTGGIIGGVLAASHDPQVKNAFQALFADAKTEFFSLTDEFVGPTLKAVGILDQALGSLNLKDVFGPVAPEVAVIAQGLADLVKNTLPGLSLALARSGPYAEAAARGFGALGTALSEFLDHTSKSHGSLEGLNLLFGTVAGTIKFFGVALEFLSNVYHAFSVVAANAAEVISKTTQIAFGGPNGFTNWVDKGAHNLRVMTGTTGEATQATGALGGALNQAATAAKKTADALQRENDELANTVDLIQKALGISLSLDQANIAVARGIMNFKEQLAETGPAWNANNEAALNQRDAILSLIGEYERVREAQIAAGVSLKEADAIYDQNVESLLKLAGQAGATKAQLEALAKTYEIKFAISGILGAIGSAASTLRNAFPGFASGGTVPGPIGAPQLAVVHGGEQVLTPSQAAYIMPGGTGAGQAVVISFNVPPSDGLGQAITAYLAKYVQVQGGGNVQLAITGKAA